jgi:hypothetical protein
MLACKYLDRIDITFLPTDQIGFAESIGATKANRPGIVYEMHLAGNPRNKDGYRSKLDTDIRKLRQGGAVLDGIPNKEGVEFLKERAAAAKDESFPTIGGEKDKPADAATKPAKQPK